MAFPHCEVFDVFEGLVSLQNRLRILSTETFYIGSELSDGWIDRTWTWMIFDIGYKDIAYHVASGVEQDQI